MILFSHLQGQPDSYSKGSPLSRSVIFIQGQREHGLFLDYGANLHPLLDALFTIASFTRVICPVYCLDRRCCIAYVRFNCGLATCTLIIVKYSAHEKCSVIR